MNFITLLGLPLSSARSFLRKKQIRVSEETIGDIHSLGCLTTGVDVMAVGVNEISQLQFYGNGDSEFRPYKGVVIANLSVSSSRQDVLTALGLPVQAFAAQQVPALGRIEQGEYFLYEGLRVFVRYHSDDTIAHLTIERAPERS